MRFDQRFEDEDLGLYAMMLLNDEDTAAIEKALSARGDLRERLGEVQVCLAAYAESVDRITVPEGSLERFMGQIEQRAEPAKRAQFLAFPEKRPASRSLGTSSRGGMVAWLGWVAAAAFAITSVGLYRKYQTVPRTVAVQSTPTAPQTLTPPPTPPLSASSADETQERDTLRATLAQQALAIQRLTAERAQTQREADGLRASLAGQATKLKGEAAQVAEAQAAQEALKNTLTIQGDQFARVTNDAGKAHQVMEALTDPTALRVTLTKPKSRPTPTGRATYLASKATLVFLASNLVPLKADKVYELWLMPADGSQPVPAGTFTPDERGNASVVYERFQHAVTAKGFSVTVENAGGAQVPTLPILLAGTAGG